MRKLLYITIIASVMFLIGGACDGVTQSLLFHYSEVKPYVQNDQFWNPNVSWVNKYKDYQSGENAKFFGSKTFLAFTTDGYHLFRFLYEGFIVLGWVTFMMGLLVMWSHLRLWCIAYTIGIWYIAKAIGFHIIYTFVF